MRCGYKRENHLYILMTSINIGAIVLGCMHFLNMRDIILVGDIKLMYKLKLYLLKIK